MKINKKKKKKKNMMAKKERFLVCFLYHEELVQLVGPTNISSFYIKGLKYFGESLGTCKSLSKTVSLFVKKLYDRKKIDLVIIGSAKR